MIVTERSSSAVTVRVCVPCMCTLEDARPLGVRHLRKARCGIALVRIASLTRELIFDLAEEGVHADAVLDSAVQQLPVPTDASGGKVALEKLHVSRPIQDVRLRFRRDTLCVYDCQEGNVRT